MAPLPDAASYQVVFDLRRQWPADWWIPVLPLIGVYVLIRSAAAGKARESRAYPFIRILFIGSAVFLSLCFAAGTTYVYTRLRAALDGGNARWVEGTVTEFVPQDAWTKRPEHFVVVTPTVRYEYSYTANIGRGGFNGSSFHPGPLKDGTRVRIADVDGVIVVLEIAR